MARNYFSQFVTLPWLVGGDFNHVLFPHEKVGGRRIHMKCMPDFRNCLMHARLEDLGFYGPSFTWSNRHHASSFIMQRLDRACANHTWLNAFPNTIVRNLVNSNSDHTALFVDADTSSVRPPKHFKFENHWTEDNTLWNLSKDFWEKESSDPLFNFFTATERLAQNAISWPLSNLNSLNKELRHLKKELTNTTLQLHLNPSYLGPIETNLRERINKL